MSFNELNDGDCPIKAGTKIERHFFGLIGPTIKEVGKLVRVGGGWVAPVQFRSGECGLLRCYARKDHEMPIVSRIVEHLSNNPNCEALLRDSSSLPRVVAGDDPGILYLRVTDVEEYSEDEVVDIEYELRLKGLLGHIGKQDEVAQCSP